MKNIFTIFLFSTLLFSTGFKSQRSEGSTSAFIIQFNDSGYEKRIPEILANLKGMEGLVYLSYCIEEKLIVMDFDLHLATLIPFGEIAMKKIPAGLSYNVKEGTVKQMKENFSNCLIEETL